MNIYFEVGMRVLESFFSEGRDIACVWYMYMVCSIKRFQVTIAAGTLLVGTEL